MLTLDKELPRFVLSEIVLVVSKVTVGRFVKATDWQLSVSDLSKSDQVNHSESFKIRLLANSGVHFRQRTPTIPQIR